MGTWTNADGLYLKFGTDKAALGRVGEHKYDGPRRCVEVKFDWTMLPLVADNSVVISDKIALPVGATIEDVVIVAHTDFTSGGSATLDVGTIDMDRTSNADPDSLVAAATPAEMSAAPADGAAYPGALVYGAKLTTAKLLTWEVNTAAFTAGEGVIRVFYSVA
jgi:hypothetical protein